MKLEVMLEDGGRTEFFVTEDTATTGATEILLEELGNGIYVETLRVGATIKITRVE